MNRSKSSVINFIPLIPLGWKPLLALALLCLVPVMFGQTTQLNGCDLKVDGVVNDEDVNTAVSMTLGQTPCTANILGNGVCNVLVVQRVVNARNGGACVVGNPHSVTLNWVASVSTGVTGYNVYRSTTSGSGYQQINTAPVAAVTYADNVVQAGLTYYYVVKARDASGNESGPSNEATAVIPMP